MSDKLQAKRPQPQGGDYRPHYRKDAADAYMAAAEARNRELAECKHTYDVNLKTLTHNHRIAMEEANHDLREMAAERDQLREQRDKLLALVSAVQWCATFQGMPNRCPVCGGFEKTGHGMWCDIGKAAIKATALPATPQLSREPAAKEEK